MCGEGGVNIAEEKAFYESLKICPISSSPCVDTDEHNHGCWLCRRAQSKAKERHTNSIDRLLNLGSHRLEVWRFDNGNIGVEYCDGWVKYGPILKGEWGEGKTFEAACEDYMRKISGKTLTFGSDERIKVL